MKKKLHSLGQMNRRSFMRLTIATGLAAGTLGTRAWAEEKKIGGMIYRTLGSTGEKVSAIGLGGAHIGNPKSEEEAIKIMRSAIDGGITFMDNNWNYHGGKSERWMGNALRDGYRDKVFLMTKIDSHSRQGATTQLEGCLKRLQTDRIDLIQFHEVIRMGDPEKIFAKGGGMEAVLEAKKAGKVRYIGFTGHKDPSIHKHMLEVASRNGFKFDAVQMPLNVMDAHFRSFEHEVLPILTREKIGVLGMKSIGFGAILKSKTVTAIECLHYALNLPTSVVITGIDSMERLEQAFEAARTFKPLNKAEIAALLARTAEAAKAGEFEQFKISDKFDGTAKHPEWLS